MDPNNPFAPGVDSVTTTLEGGPLPEGGRVDLVAALRDGTLTALGNILPIAGGFFIVFCAYVVSVCTCVGIFVSAPFMLHGLNRFMLSVVDGKPNFSAFSEGFSGDPTQVFLRGWGVILLLLLVMLPASGIAFAIQYAQQAGLVTSTIGTIVTTLGGTLWGAAVAPLTYASYVWADRNLGAIESYKASFAAFRPSWLALIGLLVAAQMVFLPTSFLAPFMQAQSETMATLPPDEVFGSLGTLLGLMGGLYSYMAVVGALSMCWTVTAYRQVVPAQAA